MVESVCFIKPFTTYDKCFVDDEEVETGMWKWLIQRTSAGFDALVRPWDKFSNVDERSVDK
jgi:hypothetical protein